MTKKITHSSRCIASVLKEKFKLLVVAAALVSGGLHAQTVTTITTAGAGTFTVPANVATMTVEAWGGGGAGGAIQVTVATGQNTIRLGGGSGGSYSKVTFTNPTAGDYPYEVGAGGTVLTGFADNAVVNGGPTTFNTTGVVAVGGNGAISRSIAATTTYAGPGATAPTAGNTDLGTNFYGGNGGTVITTIGGAGGGSAGSTGNGGNASSGTSGTAGTGGGVIGAPGTNDNGVRSHGGSPGAGGAGRVLRGTGSGVVAYLPGGNGGNGQLKISYTLAAAESTVEITAPANKTIVAIGGSTTISATVALYAGRKFSSIVFKDGVDVISGTITNVDNVYSITYTNVPSGKRNITAELNDTDMSDLDPKTFVSPIRIIYGGPVVENGNKYAQENITWSAGPWYNDPIDGNVVSAPGAGDNVFTQGNAITIAADATCDNLTFTSAPAQIGLAAGVTLTVRGQVNCTTSGSIDAFSSSNATSILKLTGTSLTTPFTLATNNALTGMKPNKVVIEPTDLANTYQFGTGTGEYVHGTNAFTVAENALVTFGNTMTLGNGGSNHFEVGAGAIVTLNNAVKAAGAVSQRITKATINGTVVAKNNFNVTELIIGTNGSLKTEKAPTGTYQQFDGWWGSVTPVNVSSFGTPGSVVAGTSSLIEFSRAGDQNVPGTVFQNGTTPAVAYSIPYANLKLSGSGTKTVQSNLVVSKNLEVVDGVIVTIPLAIVVVNTGSFTGTAPVPSGAYISATANDNVMGMVTATISATNEVALVATPKMGHLFVNWTESSSEISTDATLASFTSVDGSTRTIFANFRGIGTGLSTTKANAFVTVAGKNLLLNGDVNAVEVYNAQGKMIQSQDKVTNINGLYNGIYIIKMHTPQGVTVQKVSIR